MKKTEHILSVLLAILAIAVSFSIAEPNLPLKVHKPNLATTDVKESKAARIIVTGLIDDGLYKFIKRSSQDALANGAEYLIYEIETYGGLLKSADDIAKYFILDVGKKAHTVAYINTEAISAGAMISVSCQDIIMRHNTTIGDCAPITMGGKLEGVEREKAESFTRAAFDRAAEANKYPQALLRAMVTQQLEIWKVANLQNGQAEYFEKERLPKDANLWDLNNKELIVKDDEILTLTASRAAEYGIARAVVDDFDGALTHLENRDGVKFTVSTRVYQPNWSEQLVRWINSPAVMGILVLVAFLAVYIELHSPGIGLPGLIAVICFTIIVGSKFLIGLANWVEVAIFVLGIILLLIEFFVIPGFGVAGISGILCIIIGLFAMLVKNAPDELPWPSSDYDWQIFADGAVGLILGFVLFVICAALITKFLPKFSAFAGLSLLPAKAKKGDEFEVSMTAPPDAAGGMLKIGDVGEVVNKLRPAGKVKFADAIVNCLCQADFIDTGQKVEIIEIEGNRVIVKIVNSRE